MRRRFWLLLGLLPIVSVALFDNNLPYMILSHANFPVPDRPAILDTFQVKSEVVRFPSRDGLKIAGWFIPAAQKHAPTLIVLHGLGGTREQLLSFVLPLQKKGMNLLVVDMRSHGQSEGEFFTYGYHEGKDVAGAIDYLEQRQDDSAKHVVLLGVSGGATVAVAGAADSRVKGLVVIGGVAELAPTIVRLSPWLPNWWRDRAVARAEKMANFNVKEASSLLKIQTVKCPKLIAHGTLDDYILYRDGEQLFAAAAEPKQFFPIVQANHANMLTLNPDQLRDRIMELVNQSAR